MTVGEKKHPGRNKIGNRIVFHVRPDIEASLRQIADERDVPVTQVVRDATRFYVRALAEGRA